MTVRDSQWSDEDRNYLLALMHVEADQCPGCGNPRSQAWNPATSRTWQVVEHQCEACRIKDAVAADRAKEDGARGRFISVRRTPGVSDDG